MRRPFVAALALAGFLVCLAAFWGFGRSRRLSPSRGLATVEFLDVGQGDATLIRSPEGKTALVDAGPSGRIIEQLRARGVSSLDLVVVSHHHIDHYGGMAEVLRTFRPRVFLDADSPHVTPSYLALLRLVKEGRITAIRAGPKPRVIDLGSVRLTVFPQAPANEKDENNNSVGIRVDYGNFSVLLPGDAEASERRWWIRHAPDLCSDVEILKLAHHGSRNGTNPAWLALTRPRLAVASMASGNAFGHPHPETLALLRSEGIPLRRTDEAGSILVRTDGRSWSLGHSPATARPSPSNPRESERSRRSGPVRLNSSSEAELRTLPGIGPALGARIIRGRPCRSIEDLAAVPTPGKRWIDQVRPFVTLE